MTKYYSIMLQKFHIQSRHSGMFLAGIQFLMKRHWIPAQKNAGMTINRALGFKNKYESINNIA